MGSCAGKQSSLHKTKHSHNNKSWASETKCAEESPEIEEVKKREEKVYVSYFMDGVGLDDPIGVIVRLEEACIKLKSKIQAQKQLQSQQSTLTSISSANHLNSTRNSLNNNNIGVATVATTHQVNSKTQPPSDFNNQSIENKMQCYSTIIKLADFVQEKSQRLWENPFDDQVHDAIDSLFWAAKMLQLPCLIHFKEKVTEEIKKILPQEQYNVLYKLSFETATSPSKQGQKQSNQKIDQIEEEEYITVSQRTQ